MANQSQPIFSDDAPEPVGPYPHARIVNQMIFLSGVGPRKKGASNIPGVTIDQDGLIIEYDFDVQCRSTFENVKSIIKSTGAQWDDIVDVTVFLTNMKDDFPKLNKIYLEYFNNPQTQPSRTTVEVSALPTPIAIEVKCIAMKKESPK